MRCNLLHKTILRERICLEVIVRCRKIIFVYLASDSNHDNYAKAPFDICCISFCIQFTYTYENN